VGNVVNVRFEVFTAMNSGSSLMDCFYPEDGDDTLLRNILTKYLHGATSQKTVFFNVVNVWARYTCNSHCPTQKSVITSRKAFNTKKLFG
jgi:hypothetical protein